jgi:hypothetical protein
MTPGEKLDALLEQSAAQAVVLGRVDREQASLRLDVQDLAKAVEMTQKTLAIVLAEVQRHGQRVAPATGVPCAHACEDRRR